MLLENRGFWHPLIFLLCMPVSGSPADEVGLFALTANRQYEDQFDVRDHPRDGDLAYREMVRQGLLLTAREEFGLATRDETLLETVDRDSKTTFDVVVAAKKYHGLNFQVSRDTKQILDLYIRDMLTDANAYQVIAKAVEEHSRGRFTKLLEEAGYQRRSNVWLPSADLPSGTDELLLQMNDISQYRALRLLHKAIRTTGESPELLGALVRAYSNLAQLTIRTVDCRGYAFRCRAWLYAERLRHKTNNSAWSEWHWAYMAVMVGVPTPGKQALARAQTTTDADAPKWLELIEHYCNYRFQPLAFVADQGQRDSELATVLCIRILQQLDSKIALLDGSRHSIEQLPECLWIHEQMYQAAGISSRHELVHRGVELHSNLLNDRLPSVDENPAVSNQLLTENERLNHLQIATIASALVRSGQEDRYEPSLEVLGRNIESFNLLHIFRVADFYKISLSSDASAFVDGVLPAAEEHPLYPLLKSYRLRRGLSAETYTSIMKDFSFKDGKSYHRIPLLQLSTRQRQAGQHARSGSSRSLLVRPDGRRRVHRCRGLPN